MAVKNVDYRPLLSQNSDRGPSPQIWGDCPVTLFGERPQDGMYFFDDFLVLGSNTSSSGAAVLGSLGQWATYIYQGGTVTSGASEGSSAILQSDGDNEGVAISGGTGGFRITTTSSLALNRKLWFEARFKVSTVTGTKNDVFVGLADSFLSSGIPQAAWPIQTTDDTLFANMNAIGFHRRGTAGPTDASFVYQLSGTASVYPTNLTTPITTVTGAAAVADTYYKVGFVFDPDAYTKQVSSASTGQTAGQIAKPLVQVFVNGLAAPAFLTSTNVQGTSFPTGFMAPTIAIMNQTGSTPGTLTVDWIRVAQIANT